MRREERLTVQGPVKEQQPDGMSHRGGGGGGCTYLHHRLTRRAYPPSPPSPPSSVGTGMYLALCGALGFGLFSPCPMRALWAHGLPVRGEPGEAHHTAMWSMMS